MDRFLSFLLALLILSSCKGRFYKSSAPAMEGTIKRGERFYVVPAKEFKQNDLVVFDYLAPDYTSGLDENGQFKLKEERRVFRLIALSGDVIEIKRGEVFVNKIHLPLPKLAKMEYEVDSKVAVQEFGKIDISFRYADTSGDTLKYFVPLTTDEAKTYHTKPGILNVRIHLRDTPQYDSIYARSSLQGKWGTDDYGPLKIPSRGDSIHVNEINYRLYHNIPGVHIGLNVITEKLYFLMGDNRHYADDSRFIGLISHSKLYGLVDK